MILTIDRPYEDPIRGERVVLRSAPLRHYISWVGSTGIRRCDARTGPVHRTSFVYSERL